MSTEQSPPGRAITISQFQNALEKVVCRRAAGRFPKLGLALSGGVDSMGLLWLWSSLAASRPDLISGSRAFIVDHQARPGSAEEARRVSTEVERLTGAPAEVLKLEWPGGRKAGSFETAARRLRYRALGQACARHGIADLLVAHHADDSAETLWARLAARNYAPGLAGIAPRGNIPECEGLYGVAESGGAGRRADAAQGALPTESGGVSLARPLLGFSKRSLLATCREGGVRWVEDATNRDQTFTARNAVRHILRTARVPAALERAALEGTSARAQARASDMKAWSAGLLRQCVVHAFDTRGGLLAASVPAPSAVFGCSAEGQALSEAERYFACSAAVQYLLDIVSPREVVPLDRLGTAVSAVFPGAFPALDAQHQQRPSVNVAGVLVRRQPDPLRTNTQLVVLRRETFYRNQRQPMVLFQDEGAASAPAAGFWGQYDPTEPVPFGSTALWDGRYWIRVAGAEHPLAVVPLGDYSLAGFWAAWGGDGGALRRAKETLHQCTTDGSRGVLPALVVPPGVRGVQPGAVVALPSLGLVRPDHEGRLEWTITYKKVDTDALQAGVGTGRFREDMKAARASAAPEAI